MTGPHLLWGADFSSMFFLIDEWKEADCVLRHPDLGGGIILPRYVVPGTTCQDASRVKAGIPTRGGGIPERYCQLAGAQGRGAKSTRGNMA